jgi:hypothetical protein
MNFILNRGLFRTSWLLVFDYSLIFQFLPECGHYKLLWTFYVSTCFSTVSSSKRLSKMFWTISYGSVLIYNVFIAAVSFLLTYLNVCMAWFSHVRTPQIANTHRAIRTCFFLIFTFKTTYTHFFLKYQYSSEMYVSRFTVQTLYAHTTKSN